MFALGMTVYEVITRQTPFEGEGEMAIMAKLNERFKVSEFKLKKKGESAEQQKAAKGAGKKAGSWKGSEAFDIPEFVPGAEMVDGPSSADKLPWKALTH